MKAPREGSIQAAILQYLGLIGWVAWRNNTGAYAVAGADGKRRFIRYGTKGSGDILGLTPRGQFLAIEAKRPGEKPNADQVAWQTRVRASGGLVIVATSVDDLRLALRQAGYGVP